MTAVHFVAEGAPSERSLPRAQTPATRLVFLPAIAEFIATSDLHCPVFHPQDTCLPARDGRLFSRFRCADDPDTSMTARSLLNVDRFGRKYSRFQLGSLLLLRDDAEGGITSEAPTPRDQVRRRRLENGRRELRIAAPGASAISNKSARTTRNHMSHSEKLFPLSERYHVCTSQWQTHADLSLSTFHRRRSRSERQEPPDEDHEQLVRCWP